MNMLSKSDCRWRFWRRCFLCLRDARGTAKSEHYYLVATNIELPYWKTAAAGFQRPRTQYGVSAEMRGPAAFDPQEEVEEFRAVVARKPAGILVSVANSQTDGAGDRCGDCRGNSGDHDRLGRSGEQAAVLYRDEQPAGRPAGRETRGGAVEWQRAMSSSSPCRAAESGGAAEGLQGRLRRLSGDQGRRGLRYEGRLRHGDGPGDGVSGAKGEGPDRRVDLPGVFSRQGRGRSDSAARRPTATRDGC